jgi:hypothetical protein
MYLLQDANEPNGSWALEDGKLLDWSRKRVQPKAAVTLALALRCTFTVHGDLLEQVEVFKYLGRLLAQDNDDVPAVRQQIRKARGTWARISQVLRRENAAPRVAAKFYKAVVLSVLLYGSKTWNLTETVLAWLEGFHIRAAYRMAQKHKPRTGLFGNWIYPSTKGCARGVWPSLREGVHQYMPCYDCDVCGEPANILGVPGRGTEERVNAAQVVVGTGA